jgi:prevent-host-death family protein
MKTRGPSGAVCVNLYDAKTNLSKLVEQAMRGEPVIIAKSGTPVVKLVPVDAPAHAKRKRLGFLAGAFQVPDAATFNAMGHEEIARLFAGDE